MIINLLDIFYNYELNDKLFDRLHKIKDSTQKTQTR